MRGTDAGRTTVLGRGVGAEAPLRLLLWLSLLLPPLVFGLTAKVSWDRHFADARAAMERTLEVVHEHAVKVFETHELVAAQVDQLLSDLSDEEILANEEVLHRRIGGAADRLPQIADIWVIDRDGRPLVTARYHPIDHGLRLVDREYFRVHTVGLAPGARAYVSEILRGRFDPSARFFQFSVARSPDPARPGFNGVIGISIEPRYFDGFYLETAGATYDSISLRRSDGHVLARHPAVAEGRDRLPPGSAFFRSVESDPERGFYETVSFFEGVPRLVAYRKLAGYPLYVSVGLDRSRVVATWRSDLLQQLSFGVPATLALIAITAVAIRRTRREREALETLRLEVARREAAEEQYRQAQKMEAVGRLTGGIAHDFNNLLQIGIGSLELLERRMEAGRPDDRRLLEAARDSLRRASTLTRRLLAFARRQPLDPKVTDVNRLVRDTSAMLERMLGETIRVETVHAGGLWPARIDQHELETAILNLAVNARDAMPEGGRLTIETANAHLDEGYAASHADVKAGQYVLVSVTDTGSGMPPEVAEKAFEPFFTTKPTGEGTGLGLSQVYGFVRQSLGQVAIYSEPGHGTTVKFYLPRDTGAGEVSEPRRDAAAGPLPEGREEVILLVEDEPEVRGFAREALRELGYQVLEAESAEPALRLLDAHPTVALLLTDIVMPGENGRQLADRARALRPRLPVLFMTGYTRNAVVHNGVLEPGVNLIGKPFTIEQLARKVREVLDGRPPSPVAPPSPATDGPQPGLSVLAVEDEPIIALALESMLEELGYRVHAAASAEAALALVDAGLAPDLVVTDQNLPGMSGREMLDALAARGLVVRAVICTGYGPGPAEPGIRHLSKPYTTAALAAAIEAAFAGEPAG